MCCWVSPCAKRVCERHHMIAILDTYYLSTRNLWLMLAILFLLFFHLAFILLSLLVRVLLLLVCYYYCHYCWCSFYSCHYYYCYYNNTIQLFLVQQKLCGIFYSFHWHSVFDSQEAVQVYEDTFRFIVSYRNISILPLTWCW